MLVVGGRSTLASGALGSCSDGVSGQFSDESQWDGRTMSGAAVAMYWVLGDSAKLRRIRL